jgi:lysozyme
MKLSQLHEAPVGKWPNFIKQAAMIGAGTALTMAPRPVADLPSPSKPQTPTPIVKSEPRPLLSTGEAMAFIEPHEGRRRQVYPDSQGIPTIGVGFNLKRSDAPQRLRELGHDYQKILNGTDQLNDQEINQLLKLDVKSALLNANFFLPFQDQPKDVQLILTDMAFNLGAKGLNKFVEFQKALKIRDYSRAAKEMINSQWYNQVGNRSKKLVRMMKNITSIRGPS